MLRFIARFGLEGVALTVLQALVHSIVLGRLPVIRRALRQLPAFRPIEAHLDPAYYLRQLPVHWHSAAGRDPVLHYGLFGRFLGYAPFRGFDPAFYRADNPDLAWGHDPLAHYAARVAAVDEAELPATSPLELRTAVARSAQPPGAHVVTLQHARGGGSEKFLGLYENRLIAEGNAVTRLARDTVKASLFRPMRLGGVTGASHYRDFLLLDDAMALRDWLRAECVTRLVVNHIVDLPFEFLAWFPRLCSELHIPFDVILHDYLVICPRINLVDRNRRFCGGPQQADCVVCVRKKAGLATTIEPAIWRQSTHALLHAAERILVPHVDVVQRLRATWPGLAVDVWEPEDDAALNSTIATTLAPGAPLRIAIIGALDVPKGYDVVKRLAAYASSNALPLEFVLIGPSANDPALAAAGVRIAGRYREAEAADAIRREKPDMIFVPAIWPETWSFTLTLALRERLPVVAFDIGAVAARLRRLGCGTLWPLEHAADPAWLAARFMAERAARIRLPSR